MNANDQLLDLALRHEIERRRFGRGLEKRILGALAKSDTTLQAKLLEGLSKAGKPGPRDIWKLVATLRSAVGRGIGEAEGRLVEELTELAEHEAEWTARAINQASPIEFDIDAEIDPLEDLVVDDRLLGKWFDQLGADKAARVEAVVRIGIDEGRTIEQMAKELSEAFDISRIHARTLIRTATTAATTRARQDLLEKNSDIVKGVRWVSTLDGRTSRICASRDGNIYPVNGGPRPPAHPACRSVVVPILKSWHELGLDELDGEDPVSDRPFVRDRRKVKDIPITARAGLIGTVKATERYETWLRRQPAEFQDDVLGKTKGALFRRGGLTLDKFVDESGHEWTIDELRRREAAAFRKAGVD